jgi:hypothetical protein
MSNLQKYFNLFTKHQKLSTSEKDAQLAQFVDMYNDVPVDQLLSSLIFQIENQIHKTPNPSKELRDGYVKLLKEYELALKRLTKVNTIESPPKKTGITRNKTIEQLKELKEKLLIQSVELNKKLLLSKDAMDAYPSSLTEREYNNNVKKMEKMKRDYNSVVTALHVQHS